MKTAADLLGNLNTPAYIIASLEIIVLHLIKSIVQTGKLMIIYTGMADLLEITEAVETARENGCDKIALLHCTSSYPAPVEEPNPFTIPDLAKKFNVGSGL